jgi:cyclopropane-fatty-acyl-phospholipid synthase
MKSIVAQGLKRIGASSPVAFKVTFADGEIYRNRDGPPAFTMHFKSRAAEWGIAAFGHIGMCDAYFDGDLDVEGDLRAVIRTGMIGGYDKANALVEQRNRWHELRHSNASRGRAKENAQVHYGLGTEFYRLWLDDPLMMYTCG